MRGDQSVHLIEGAIQGDTSASYDYVKQDRVFHTWYGGPMDLLALCPWSTLWQRVTVKYLWWEPVTMPINQRAMRIFTCCNLLLGWWFQGSMYRFIMGRGNKRKGTQWRFFLFEFLCWSTRFSWWHVQWQEMIKNDEHTTPSVGGIPHCIFLRVKRWTELVLS